MVDFVAYRRVSYFRNQNPGMCETGWLLGLGAEPLAAPGTYVGLWVRSVGSIRLSGQSVLLLVRGLNPGI